MKAIIAAALLAVFAGSAMADYTNGYYRSNGTYVNGYVHAPADGNPYNNYRPAR